ncbi:MAG TPA: hypothetical protein VMI53_02440 [Opitutaceae bacterium]|nr:hypothetical protein [Opitutaceae bacterium]
MRPLNHPMRSLNHLLHLTRDPAHPGMEIIAVASRRDVEWNRPVFKAPSLPTPQQLGGEVPFSVHFRDGHSHPRLH